MEGMQPLSPSSHRPATPAPLRMVTVGDSLTAGMQDVTLVKDRQDRSYGKMLADHVGIPFRQPDITEHGIPPRLFRDKNVSLLPVLIDYVQVGLAMAAPLAALAAGTVPPELLLEPLYRAGHMGERVDPKAPVDNFAIPGFELRHLTDVGNVKDLMQEMADKVHHPLTLPALGPYVHSILQDDRGASHGKDEITRAAERDPDLVLLWAGNNDALEGVVTGGVVDDRTLTPMEDGKWTYHSYNPITGRGRLHETKTVQPGFRTSMDGVVTRLLDETDAHVVMMNIPNVTVVPFLRTVGEKVGPLPFRCVLPDGTDLTKWIEDFTIPAEIRGEGRGGRTQFPGGTRLGLVMLLAKFAEMAPTGRAEEFFAKAQALQGGVFTEDEVLDPAELGQIQTRVDEYNALIAGLAEREERVHLVDVNGLLNRAATEGVALRGEGPDVRATNTFTGLQDSRGYEGIFSFDGVHPSDVGHAVLANAVKETVARELGDDERFRAFVERPPLDEKAALQGDPHRADRAVLVLRPGIADPMMTRRT